MQKNSRRGYITWLNSLNLKTPQLRHRKKKTTKHPSPSASEPHFAARHVHSEPPNPDTSRGPTHRHRWRIASTPTDADSGGRSVRDSGDIHTWSLKVPRKMGTSICFYGVMSHFLRYSGGSRYIYIIC